MEFNTIRFRRKYVRLKVLNLVDNRIKEALNAFCAAQCNRRCLECEENLYLSIPLS